MDNESTPFCEKNERAGLKCRPCFDHVCQIKGKEQRMYKGFNIHDVITIEPDKRGGFSVQSDVEVPFKVDPKKSPMSIMSEMQKHEVILSLELGRKMPEGMRGPWYHRHYSANGPAPDIAALHVHIAGTAKTPQEAKRMADDMWGIIDADRLTKLLE